MHAVQQGKFGITMHHSFIPKGKLFDSSTFFTSSSSAKPFLASPIYNTISAFASITTKHRTIISLTRKLHCKVQLVVHCMMADVRGTTTRAMGERSAAAAATLTASREKIEPSSDWTEDSHGHYLLVDLPDFKKDEVKLEVSTSGQMIVRGERKENEKKYVYFELYFPIPPYSDVDKITGKFDGEVLYVIVPKVVAVMEEKKEPETLEKANVESVTAAENMHPKPINDIGECSNKHDGTNGGECSNKLGNAHIFFSPENIRKWEREEGILRSAMEMLRKNKGIVITAALAFSLGMLISQKFQSTGR